MPWPVPPKLSVDLPTAPFPIQRASFPYQNLVAIPSLPDRAPTYNCSALSFISIVLIQNWTPRSNRRRIKIIKLTAGFCLASSCDIHCIHPAGNPTVRQLPGAIAITELSIQCHLASSFQLVDVAGSRSCDRLRSLVPVMPIFDLFRELPCRRESENAPRKYKQLEKVCARNCINTRVASLFSRT